MSKAKIVVFRKQFTNPATGKRESIFFGKMTPSAAQRAKEYIDRLIVCKRLKTVPDETVQRWLMGIADEQREKLAAVGLVQGKERTTLGGFVNAFIKRRENAVKKNTIIAYKQEARKLFDYFGGDKNPETISLREAEEFAAHLRSQGYAEANIDKIFKQCRLFFNEMIKHEILQTNVFSKVKTSDKPDESRNHYISRELTQRIIDAGCPDAQWRALVALMRYGGMRCPSEVLLLRWEDVDFTGEKGFFSGMKVPAIKFRSIKTERHTGGGSRTIPMFKEIRPYLEDAWFSIPEGERRNYVIWDILPIAMRENEPMRLKKNFSKAFCGILKKLGIDPWEKLFVNLRRSCRNDLEREYPSRVVDEWMGHSEKVANAHYVQMLPGDIERAVYGNSNLCATKSSNPETSCKTPDKTPSSRVQNRVQQEQYRTILRTTQNEKPRKLQHIQQEETPRNDTNSRGGTRTRMIVMIRGF